MVVFVLVVGGGNYAFSNTINYVYKNLKQTANNNFKQLQTTAKIKLSARIAQITSILQNKP
jgi:autotransporter adhesin